MEQVSRSLHPVLPYRGCQATFIAAGRELVDFAYLLKQEHLLHFMVRASL